MKIKYNEIEKSIEIKDELKTHYLFIKVLLVLNLISAVLYLININESGIGVKEAIFLVTGIISLVVMYILIFKKSTAKKIPIEKIERLNEKSIFRKKRLSLKLKNGKKRDLTELKSESEFNELKNLFAEIGIPN